MSDRPEERTQQPGDTPAARLDTFRTELAGLINRHSRENHSNTPDFILAQYLVGCLAVFDNAISSREDWYGRRPQGVLVNPEPRHEAAPGPAPVLEAGGDRPATFTAPKMPPPFVPAKPVAVASDPDKWPQFPGQDLDYTGLHARRLEEERKARYEAQQANQAGGDPGDEDIHTGGPRL